MYSNLLTYSWTNVLRLWGDVIKSLKEFNNILAWIFTTFSMKMIYMIVFRVDEFPEKIS